MEYTFHKRDFLLLGRQKSLTAVLVVVPDSSVTLFQHNQYATEAHFGYPGPQHCENTNPRENKAPCPSGGLNQG